MLNLWILSVAQWIFHNIVKIYRSTYVHCLNAGLDHSSALLKIHKKKHVGHTVHNKKRRFIKCNVN